MAGDKTTLRSLVVGTDRQLGAAHPVPEEEEVCGALRAQVWLLRVLKCRVMCLVVG